MPTLAIKTWEQLSKEELYAILQARAEVFVVEQRCIFLDIDDRDQTAHHVIAVDNHNNRLAAYCRICPPHNTEGQWSISRVITRQAYRGQGLANQLIATAIDFIRARGAQKATMSAQLYLQSFYEKHGFTVTSDVYQDDGIDHVDMIMEF